MSSTEASIAKASGQSSGASVPTSSMGAVSTSTSVEPAGGAQLNVSNEATTAIALLATWESLKLLAIVCLTIITLERGHTQRASVGLLKADQLDGIQKLPDFLIRHRVGHRHNPGPSPFIERREESEVSATRDAVGEVRVLPHHRITLGIEVERPRPKPHLSSADGLIPRREWTSADAPAGHRAFFQRVERTAN
jgi:hypothetical protein